MSIFSKLLDHLFGIERFEVPISKGETKDLIFQEGGKTLTTAELYEEVTNSNEKERADAVNEFLIGVNNRTSS
jgi:hypothetical protein